MLKLHFRLREIKIPFSRKFRRSVLEKMTKKMATSKTEQSWNIQSSSCRFLKLLRLRLMHLLIQMESLPVKTLQLRMLKKARRSQKWPRSVMITRNQGS